MSDHPPNLQVFTDGSYEPGSKRGGWAYVVYRDRIEITSGFGSVDNLANNSLELIALLNAAIWIDENAAGEPAVIYTDSLLAVNGSNKWRHIWKNNGWKRIEPNFRRRTRAIENREIWKSIDSQLCKNSLLVIAWCKGHSDIEGNTRADELAHTAATHRPPL